MTVSLQVSVGRNKYDLSCEENEQERIVELARRLNKRVNIISMNLGRASDVVILFITSIIIQREIDIANDRPIGTFYNYLMQTSKKVNNIVPAMASLEDKDERERLFISSLNLENELYALSNGGEIDYLSQETAVEESQIKNNDTGSGESQEFQEQMKEMIGFLEELTSNTNKLSAKIKDF